MKLLKRLSLGLFRLIVAIALVTLFCTIILSIGVYPLIAVPIIGIPLIYLMGAENDTNK